MPDVSTIVVTYNAMPWVERALESAAGTELVVVDHGSRDGTVELVRERFPAAIVVEQENKGFGAGDARCSGQPRGAGTCCDSDGLARAGCPRRARGLRRAASRRGVVGPRPVTLIARSSAPGGLSERAGGSRPSTCSCASWRPGLAR